VALAASLAAVLLPAASPLLSLDAESAFAAGCRGSGKGPHKITTERAARAVTCLINERRRHHGRSRLRARGSLVQAAERHSARMQERSCYSHKCPGEAGLEGRVTSTGYLPCGCAWGLGENIAWGRRSRGSPSRIVRSWMHPGYHRETLLDGSFRHVGVGVVWGSASDPGARVGIFTADFGYKR